MRNFCAPSVLLASEVHKGKVWTGALYLEEIMNASAEGQALCREDEQFVDNLVLEHAGRPGMLLTVLEGIQEHQRGRYLAREYLEYLAQRTDIPASQIFSVATFYALFNLRPQGLHTVCICRGTACHTRGSQRLLEAARLQLGLVASEDDDGSADKISATTSDGQFTVRTVACFGQCALAPVVEVNHQILSHVNERTLSRHVDALRTGKR